MIDVKRARNEELKESAYSPVTGVHRRRDTLGRPQVYPSIIKYRSVRPVCMSLVRRSVRQTIDQAIVVHLPINLNACGA